MAARRTVSWSTWPAFDDAQRTTEASIGFYTHGFAQSKEYRPVSRSTRRRTNFSGLVTAGNRYFTLNPSLFKPLNDAG
jgi:hypothetical protein